MNVSRFVPFYFALYIYCTPINAQVGGINGACGAQYPIWYSHNPEQPYCWRKIEHLWYHDHDNAPEMCDFTADWTTVFQDNFDGTSIDQTNWKVCGVGNDYYKNSDENYCFGGDGMANYQVSNGVLRIKIKDKLYPGNPFPNDPDKFYQYSTGQIVSNKMFSTGKYEARIRFNGYEDINWAPLWLREYGTKNGSQPYFQEIDYEFGLGGGSTCIPSMTFHKQQPNKVDINGNTIYKNGKPEACSDGTHPSCSASLCYADNQWHTLVLEFNTYNIRWYIDGLLLREIARTYDLGCLYSISECVGPGDEYLLGGWFHRNPMMPTYPNMQIHADAAPLPSLASLGADVSLDIDYIKYSKKINCNSEINLCSHKQTEDPNPPDLDHEDPTIITGGKINVAGGGCVYNTSGKRWGEHVALYASKSVVLNPGFTAVPNYFANTFSAQIVPCTVQSFKQEFTDPYTHDPAFENKEQVLNMPSKIDQTENLPKEFEKGKRYMGLRPNPASTNVMVSYVLPVDAHVLISLTDATGTALMKIEEGDYISAAYKMNVSVADLSSGIYFVKLQANDYIETQKLVVQH